MISLFHAKPKAKPVKKRDGGKGGESLHLAIDGAPVAVKLRLNPRARRVIVKVDPGTGDVTVVAPSRTGLKHALDFARGEHDWIARQRARVPQQVTLAPGAKLPFRGQAHEVRDFLKREARALCEASALEYGARLGVLPARITMRDTASRWGSCSAARAVSFSWRLIFAPDFVRDYVVAHEVAHLKEMNHGPRFWTLVEKLHPQFEVAQDWLRVHGRSLQRYKA